MDVGLRRVAAEVRAIERGEQRFAMVIRETFDQIYDGVHTGRYRWDQLRKTEKTHAGSLVEINLQREFGFADGDKLDFELAGLQVDCKFSAVKYGWMFPIESIGEICLVVTADDELGLWSVGLIRVLPDLLGAPNRDQKRSLSAAARDSIEWLWEDRPLPPNVLLRLPDNVVREIFFAPDGTPRSGQQRVNELFRRVQGKRIPRGTIATVAQQVDYMKRVRGNGGARTLLRDEGIVIFGHYEAHRQLASGLGLPIPQKGECVAVRLASAEEGVGVEIDGAWWRLANEDEEVSVAPLLPKA